VPTPTIVTVGLNPAIDRVLEVKGFTVGAHQSGREVTRAAGGKAVNLSRALSSLGVRNVATGFVGAENRGDFDPVLKAQWVRDEFFSLPGRTRENVTIADPTTGQDTHIRASGLAVSAEALDKLANKLRLLADADDVVLFSGSLPPGIGAEAFAELAGQCIERGARVGVDTSGNALREAGRLPLWAVKPNQRELPALAGTTLEGLEAELDAARELTGRFENVLYTRGAEGAYLLRKDLALFGRVDVDPRRIRNTVGCGDALLAGFVAGTWRDQPWRYCFRDAVAAATAAAMSFGPGEIDPDDFLELQERVAIDDL
jgi:1-phosphofructokinase family hexose kinase